MNNNKMTACGFQAWLNGAQRSPLVIYLLHSVWVPQQMPGEHMPLALNIQQLFDGVAVVQEEKVAARHAWATVIRTECQLEVRHQTCLHLQVQYVCAYRNDRGKVLPTLIQELVQLHFACCF